MNFKTNQGHWYSFSVYLESNLNLEMHVLVASGWKCLSVMLLVAMWSPRKLLPFGGNHMGDSLWRRHPNQRGQWGAGEVPAGLSNGCVSKTHNISAWQPTWPSFTFLAMWSLSSLIIICFFFAGPFWLATEWERGARVTNQLHLPPHAPLQKKKKLVSALSGWPLSEFFFNIY